MRVEPDRLPLGQDLTGTATVRTEPAGGPPIVVRLSATAPDWMTVTFDPADITPGASSTMTITARPDVRPVIGVVHVRATGPVSGATEMTVEVPPVPWRPGTGYKVDDVVVHGTEWYVCRKAHTSRPGRTPPRSPALWRHLG
ncbi:hypothetical protein C1I98_06905 [Spongiactinospora gelatinilytica]|uniref:Chitin-binding type-3 domain-containing protein n=1 Tax=Spongiactinospora gelatinilytica TaxID=2666298 RepID=A0A2W2HME7_9ACTN|nr:carbohydrate-binding protein [Spongiactinospora gelatinilytica]PZG52805.1 hypothetical protein C1I98_06905 [Spongiactinospora gelatinilytica]